MAEGQKCCEPVPGHGIRVALKLVALLPPLSRIAIFILELLTTCSPPLPPALLLHGIMRCLGGTLGYALIKKVMASPLKHRAAVVVARLLYLAADFSDRALFL